MEVASSKKKVRGRKISWRKIEFSPGKNMGGPASNASALPVDGGVFYIDAGALKHLTIGEFWPLDYWLLVLPLVNAGALDLNKAR